MGADGYNHLEARHSHAAGPQRVRQALEGCRNVGGGIAGMTVQDQSDVASEAQTMDEDLARAEAL